MIALYLGLLGSGLALFILSYVAPFRVAKRLREHYPQHWQTIVEAASGRLSAFRLWVNMQGILRSPALPALNDTGINRWSLIWRYSQWLGWLCWLGALGMRLWLR